MKAYLISIIVATLISAIINIITPEKWTKYVGVVTGIVVTVCIAQPIINIMRADVFGGISYTLKQSSNDGEKVLYSHIKEEMEKRISADVEARIKRDFGKECKAKTEITITENGEVKGVKAITISGDKIDNIVIGKLREVYAPKEVKYAGR